MIYSYNKKLVGTAQALRKRMTPEEKHLWYDFLKKLPCTVNRQKVVGKYILDFYCAEAKIAIELDGSQHYEEQAKKNDADRDQFLSEQGITVLRYTNEDIEKRFNAVCEDILKFLKK